MKYYIQWECPSCDETNYFGVCMTLLTHNGLPCIMLGDGEQQTFECEHCQKVFYSGELELFED